MRYFVKPIVCDYAVICADTKEIVCICNIRRNAELIADILNVDENSAYSYDIYPYAKYKAVKKEREK